MAHSRSYRIIAWLFNVFWLVCQVTIAVLFAWITGQTFQRTRATRTTSWPMPEM